MRRAPGWLVSLVLSACPLAMGPLAGCDTMLGEARDGAALPDGGIPSEVGELADGGPLDAGPLDGGASDGGATDGGGSDGGMPDAPPPPPTGRVLYTTDRAQSPLTADVAEGLRRIASVGARDEHVLSRVGDSITRSTSFLNCFAGSSVNLDGRTALMPTIAHFNTGRVGGMNPFTRASLAATDGWSASAPLTGAPSPLTSELSAAHPGYASLMYGTNDVGFRDPDAYSGNMLDIVDAMLAAGAIPVMSTIPPRDDSAAADARVPLFNAIVRGIAQGRGVPLVDFHRALVPLTEHGLGGDNVHPNVTGGGCVFTAAGLGYGYNQRNLLVVTALDRARRAVAGEAPPDGDVPRMRGSGSAADPFVAGSFPFTDLRDTRSAGAAAWASYPACSPANEGGRELVYRLTLDRAARIHAWVFDRGTTDVDIHLLDGRGEPAGCLSRNDEEVSLDAAAGTYHLVIDTFVDGAGAARAGEYLLIVLLE